MLAAIVTRVAGLTITDGTDRSLLAISFANASIPAENRVFLSFLSVSIPPSICVIATCGNWFLLHARIANFFRLLWPPT